jgi:hypothetical protein
MNRFEQLIEYVINDEDAKARELFHDIVVAKSREIYENLMQEEAEEDLEEGAEEDLDEDAMGGDAADDLIDNIEADEEQDMSMESEESDAEFDDGAEEAGDDLTHDIEDMNDEGGGEPASKDDILNLEDKLDQLMAEFEDLMGGDDMGNGDGFGPDEGGDAIEMDDTEEMGMMEAVSLKAAPKPVTSEEGGVNKKSAVAANAGAKGPIGNSVKPVHAGGEMGGKHDSSAYSNSTKDLIGDFQNKAGNSMKGQKPANKPHLAQATGVNTKSPVARG